MLLGDKKAKKALLKNAKNLDEICNMYYEIKKFTDIVKDREYKKEYYVHRVEEIFEKFNINSISELLFLIRYHIGEVVRECEFCGFPITKIKTRNNPDGSFDDCKHKGLCMLCENPYTSANEDGVCYACKPYQYEKSPYDDFSEQEALFNFVRIIQDPSDIKCMIKTQNQVLSLMKVASYFYHLIKEYGESIDK